MRIFLYLLILFSCNAHAQFLEGQSFCKENPIGSYFPTSLQKKKIFWGKTYYIETITGTKEMNGKTYTEFRQEWENKEVAVLYLREENGIVYEYEECCKEETIRYNPDFKKGHEWQTVDGVGHYKIISFNGKLKTPYCEYKGLLVLESKMNYGVFNFYYLKGFGYVGATSKDVLISCMTPE